MFCGTCLFVVIGEKRGLVPSELSRQRLAPCPLPFVRICHNAQASAQSVSVIACPCIRNCFTCTSGKSIISEGVVGALLSIAVCMRGGVVPRVTRRYTHTMQGVIL